MDAIMSHRFGNKRHNLLVMSDLVGSSDVRRLRKFANVYRSSEIDEKTLPDRLRETDALLISSWPKILTDESLRSMKRLRFIQGILVGVDHIPFQALARKVVVCSNAGAYSLEVGEHAFGLLLSAAKKVVDTHNSVARGKTNFKEFRGTAEDVLVLRGKRLGVVGYGGIGAVVAGLGRSFGMNVIALSRSRRGVNGSGRGVEFMRGRGALASLLAGSDAVVLALPLTRLTEGMIDARELSVMKKDAVLVNISRGDIVNQTALYEHLRRKSELQVRDGCVVVQRGEGDPCHGLSFLFSAELHRHPTHLGSDGSGLGAAGEDGCREHTEVPQGTSTKERRKKVGVPYRSIVL